MTKLSDLYKEYPKYFYGYFFVLFLIISGLIIGIIMASKACKKDEKDKFGNILITTLDGTKQAIKNVKSGFSAEETKKSLPWWGWVLIVIGAIISLLSIGKVLSGQIY